MNQELQETQTPFAKAVGRSIQARRKQLGMTQDELVKEVNSLLGRSWGKREMSLIENGKRSELPGSALLAFAQALKTTLQQLLHSPDPVDLGGGQRSWLDALAAGKDQEPSERAWAKLHEAGQMLAKIRELWEDYGSAIYAVRAEIAADPMLAESIEESFIQRAEVVGQVIAQLHDEREGDFNRNKAVNANLTPMAVALKDALGSGAQPASPWAAWGEREARS